MSAVSHKLEASARVATWFGAGGGVAASHHDESGKVGKHYNEEMSQLCRTSIKKIGGPQETDNMVEWAKAVASNNRRWAVIGIGDEKCAIWDLVERNHK